MEAAYVPGTRVAIATNEGTYPLSPNAQGKLGVIVAPAVQTFGYQLSNFLFSIAALSFGLNFFVAIFNLLPLPAFDGWRIYRNRVRSKKALKLLSLLLVIAILLNVLPWIWTIG